MTGRTLVPFFSVIIPSRNRPVLLSRAVTSVLAQDCDDLEIVIVDDGSEPALQLADLDLQNARGIGIKVVNLCFQPRGRGPGYARNVGVWSSKGQYCAFLDDDDTWTKSDHLSLARRSLTAGEAVVDMYLSNQLAHFPDSRKPEPLWLYPLAEKLADSRPGSGHGFYTVDVNDLLAARAFSHLNTTIVSRALFDAIGGIDEYVSYEEDMDFYFRALGEAKTIVYCPDIIARHNVPDRYRSDNASTAIRYLQKMNVRLFLLNKIIIDTRNEAIARYCNLYAADTMKHMAEDYVQRKEFNLASSFALQALARRLSLKWFAYSVYLLGRAALSGGKGRGR
jgi:glycosyltransferase involved in cell wall biosynthesis